MLIKFSPKFSYKVLLHKKVFLFHTPYNLKIEVVFKLYKNRFPVFYTIIYFMSSWCNLQQPYRHSTTAVV